MSSGPYAMSGGDGQNSYVHNSLYQRWGVEKSKTLIDEAISDKLETQQIVSTSNSFCIADLGCSVGPNTFIAVHNIVKSIKRKCRSCGLNEGVLEYQVFFSDQVANDFNTLFRSIPSSVEYFAAGAPGSFRGRLFPKASINFMHCSYAIHWLSQVPDEVLDRNSLAWNGNEIYYTTAGDEVVEAFKGQFNKDTESFLSCRAEEIVEGGLMALLLPCLQDGVAPSECNYFAAIDLLGNSLAEMANMGLTSKAKVESFNIPKYNPRPKELAALIQKNGRFSIEKMTSLIQSFDPDMSRSVEMVVSHLRAVYEVLVRDHFGEDIIDALFDVFKTKVAESSIVAGAGANQNQIVELFVLLKRT